MKPPKSGNLLVFQERLERLRKNQRAAKTHWAIYVIGILVVGFALGIITFTNGQICIQGNCFLGTAQSAGTNGAGSSNNGANSVNQGTAPQYLGFQWQLTAGGGTPSAVGLYAYPSGNPNNLYTKTSASVNTQYTSPNAIFTFGSGFCTQLYSTTAYPVAECHNAGGSFPLASLPGYTDQITATSCLVSSTNTPCINVVPTYPASYTNSTSSASAVTTTLIPSFSGTTIPTTTFTLTVNFVGVSGRGGGVGQDQLASGTVLGGIPNNPVMVYSGGTGSASSPGQIIPTQSVAYIETNQTNLALNSCGPLGSANGLTTGQLSATASGVIYSGTSVWWVQVAGSAVTTSTAASNPQYAFAQFTCSFTNNSITTGKKIAIVVGALDNQQAIGFDNFHFLDNSGLTGTAVCSSSATTNMCDNSSDITTGTYQAIAGLPVSWGGGGSGSATKPAWVTPTTGPNAGWGTFAPIMTFQGGTVVYGT